MVPSRIGTQVLDAVMPDWTRAAEESERRQHRQSHLQVSKSLSRLGRGSDVVIKPPQIAVWAGHSRAASITCPAVVEISGTSCGPYFEGRRKAREKATQGGQVTMKSRSESAESPSELIDARVEELGDWRGEMLSRLRA